jgi:hypothetical protein
LNQLWTCSAKYLNHQIINKYRFGRRKRVGLGGEAAKAITIPSVFPVPVKSRIRTDLPDRIDGIIARWERVGTVTPMVWSEDCIAAGTRVFIWKSKSKKKYKFFFSTIFNTLAWVIWGTKEI